VPWRARDFIHHPLRRRGGRPQLKRDPLGRGFHMHRFKTLPKISILAAAVSSSVPAAARAQTPAKATVSPPPVCAPPVARAPAGRVRIDGWFGPAVNDSLIIVVDNTVRWRGLYRLCSESPASGTVPWLPDSSDSIRNVSVITGDTVRATFHVGGSHPSAVIIETRRRP